MVRVKRQVLVGVCCFELHATQSNTHHYIKSNDVIQPMHCLNYITTFYRYSLPHGIYRLKEVLIYTGRGVSLRHYRNGSEVIPSVALDQDLNYDFNYQQYRSVTPRKIMPVSLFRESQLTVLDTHHANLQTC